MSSLPKDHTASSQLSLDLNLDLSDPKVSTSHFCYNSYHYYPNVELNILKHLFFLICIWKDCLFSEPYHSK